MTTPSTLPPSTPPPRAPQVQLSSLVRHGSTLAALLREAKLGTPTPTPTPTIATLHERVEVAVTQLLPLLDADGGEGERRPAGLIKECVDKVRRKIIATLDDFINLDPAHEPDYRQLTTNVSNTAAAASTSSTAVASLSLLSPSPLLQDDDDEEEAEEEEFDFDSRFEKLDSDEKECMFLFSIIPNGSWKVIQTKLGRLRLDLECDLLRTHLSTNSVLMLEKEGFIEPVINNKFHEVEHSRFMGIKSHRVRASARVRSKVLEKAMAEPNLFENSIALLKEGSSAPVYPNGKLVESVPSIESLVNISEHTLDAKTLEYWLSKTINLVVLDLGVRHGAVNHIIVAEDTGFLHALPPSVRVLSLRGISGIVELPAAVFKLKCLKTLDLRACHSLEYLPKGIGELSCLEKLDLSECYLLDHIPKAIASLEELTVLKGFVVNPDSAQQIGNASSSCAFSDLTRLHWLKKLTIRTRRMYFPTTQEIHTLYNLKHLKHFGVTWVGSVSSSDDAQGDINDSPYTLSLRTLKLQAVPNDLAASRLLSMFRISKLCISGGQLQELGLTDFPDYNIVEFIRLRYLPKLQLDWNFFIRLFPDLIALEIYKCPNLTNFPCDEDGVWEKQQPDPLSLFEPYLSDSSSLSPR